MDEGIDPVVYKDTILELFYIQSQFLNKAWKTIEYQMLIELDNAIEEQFTSLGRTEIVIGMLVCFFVFCVAMIMHKKAQKEYKIAFSTFRIIFPEFYKISGSLRFMAKKFFPEFK